ncbi:hypothetical protein DFP72DRAFT_856047 [Ephemerocybe angulata]|uniref:Uncharacterized protein n=1 Tax=Ephemerocybe angulata TaxID=980116 RepID=A0A8H6LYZ6_9AGAR|nr:hypothetical protein DFP72DRAFT_856047 [Tulosesus angulatus]
MPHEACFVIRDWDSVGCALPSVRGDMGRGLQLDACESCSARYVYSQWAVIHRAFEPCHCSWVVRHGSTGRKGDSALSVFSPCVVGCIAAAYGIEEKVVAAVFAWNAGFEPQGDRGRQARDLLHKVVAFGDPVSVRGEIGKPPPLPGMLHDAYLPCRASVVRELLAREPLGRIRVGVLEVQTVLSLVVELGGRDVERDLDLAHLAELLDSLGEELKGFAYCASAARQARAQHLGEVGRQDGLQLKTIGRGGGRKVEEETEWGEGRGALALRIWCNMFRSTSSSARSGPEWARSVIQRLVNTIGTGELDDGGAHCWTCVGRTAGTCERVSRVAGLQIFGLKVTGPRWGVLKLPGSLPLIAVPPSFHLSLAIALPPNSSTLNGKTKESVLLLPSWRIAKEGDERLPVGCPPRTDSLMDSGRLREVGSGKVGSDEVTAALSATADCSRLVQGDGVVQSRKPSSVFNTTTAMAVDANMVAKTNPARSGIKLKVDSGGAMRWRATSSDSLRRREARSCFKPTFHGEATARDRRAPQNEVEMGVELGEVKVCKQSIARGSVAV